MTSLPSFPRVFRQDAGETEWAYQLDVLWVGPWHTPEFALVQAMWGGAVHRRTAACLEYAIDQLAAQVVAPEVVLLAQSLPGDIRQADVDRLQRLAPLARMVVVAGTWCEGELRNRRPLTGVMRLYWYEFPAWWRAAREQLTRGLSPLWSQPLDRPLAGRWDGRVDLPSDARGAVVVAADDYAVYETWAAALEPLSRRALWRRCFAIDDLPDEVTAGIWDGGQLSNVEMTRLGVFCERVRASDGRVVALLDFPRCEHGELAAAAGVHALFGKPYVVDEVVAALG